MKYMLLIGYLCFFSSCLAIDNSVLLEDLKSRIKQSYENSYNSSYSVISKVFDANENLIFSDSSYFHTEYANCYMYTKYFEYLRLDSTEVQVSGRDELIFINENIQPDLAGMAAVNPYQNIDAFFENVEGGVEFEDKDTLKRLVFNIYTYPYEKVELLLNKDYTVKATNYICYAEADFAKVNVEIADWKKYNSTNYSVKNILKRIAYKNFQNEWTPGLKYQDFEIIINESNP